MTNLTNDALSKAIEALEEAKLRITELCICHSHPAPTATIERVEEALSALSALSQEARPVAYATVTAIDCLKNEGRGFVWRDKDGESDIPLYAHPQPAQQDARDAERLNFLITEECQVWEVNWRYSIHAVTEHHAITDEFPTAREAIDAALAQKGGGK